MAIRLSKDRLAEMFEEIRLAQELHALWIQEGWQNVAYLEGRPGRGSQRMGLQHRAGGPATRVPVNIFHSFYKSTSPRLFPRRFRARCEPEDPGYLRGAEQLEAILAWNQKVTGWRRESRCAVTNAMLYGRGILRHGFSGPLGGLPPSIQQQQQAATKVYNTQALEVGEALGIEDVMEEARMGANGIQRSEAERASLRRPRLHTDQHIVANRPWALSTAPEDLLMDPRADFWWKCRYMVHTHYWMRPQFEEYARRKGLRLDGKVPGYSFQEAWPYAGMSVEATRGHGWIERHASSGPDRDVIKLFEYMDLEHGIWALLAHGYEHRAIEVQLWPFPTDSFPYSFCDFTERQGLLYPVADLTYHQSKQDQINLFNAVWSNNLARSKKIIGWQKGVADEEEIKAAKKARGMAFVAFTQPVEHALKMIDLADDPTPFINAIEVLKMQSRSEYGATAEEQGQVSQVKGGATQAAILNVKSENLQEWRQEVVTEWQEDACRHQGTWIQTVWPLMQQAGAVTPERLIGSNRIFRGAPGLSPKGQILRADGMSLREIEADYRWSYEVDLDSKRGRDEKSQRILDTANILFPTGRVNWDAVAEKVAELGEFGMVDFLKPPKDIPSADREHENMLMGIPAIIDPKEDSEGHLEIHMEVAQAAMQFRGQMEVGGSPNPQTRLMVTAFANQPQAMELLAAHIEETQARIEGGPGTPGRSLRDKAVDPNRGRQVEGARAAQTQKMRGVPPGNINKAAGQLQSFMGMK